MRESIDLFHGEKKTYPLAPLTSWRIGGYAARFYRPTSLEALRQYLAFLPAEVPCTWIGLGSNVLIRDGGIQGSVICTRSLKAIQQSAEGLIVAEAGVTCAQFARFCVRLGFKEAAFFAGIPGTIGGALAMNAGAFGGETWEWVEAVEVLDRIGKRKVRSAQDYDITYRTVRGKTLVQKTEAFVKGFFRFPYQGQQDMRIISKLLSQRKLTQPIGTLNCGSVYQNPPGDHAARLIEACDLKGYQIGGAMISKKHANFIINSGVARAQEVEDLMTLIETQVQARFGVMLQKEVKILGQQ